jgi:hypothetical protein
MQISKSEYMMFLKHPAWLWLKKNNKKALPPPDQQLQALFDAGNEFEGYAQALFPGGVNLGFENYNEYGAITSAYKHVDWHVYQRPRDFLTRRHKVQGRGMARFSCDIVYGELGLIRLERLPRSHVAAVGRT